MSSERILAAGRRVIDEEAAALTALSGNLGEAFIKAVDALATAKGRVVVTGMGKSGHVARKIAATLASTGTPAIYIHPGEASHGDLGMITADDFIIALSRSGETSELGDLIAHARAQGLTLLAITTQAASTLATTASIALILPDVAEACAATGAPTTSTTMMLALGDALAVALLERKGFTAEDFKRFHPGGQLGAMLRTVGDLMHVGREMPLVASGTSLPEALEEMSAKGFGCLGITGQDGTLIGILTDGDVRRMMARGDRAETIDQAMMASPITLTPDTRASIALALMNTRRITQLFVLENGKLAGIVHMHDFLRAGVS